MKQCASLSAAPSTRSISAGRTTGYSASNSRRSPSMPAGQDQDPPAGADAPERERGGAIRVWAKDHGIAVSDRGRIPGSEVERYQAATRGL